jgi:predicted transcriptional regulator
VPATKAPGKPPGDKVSDRSNKKAEVIAMMKRTKGATLAEIMEATGWQKHTVRGFVSILSSKGGQSIESSKNAAAERTYKIAK